MTEKDATLLGMFFGFAFGLVLIILIARRFRPDILPTIVALIEVVAALSGIASLGTAIVCATQGLTFQAVFTAVIALAGLIVFRFANKLMLSDSAGSSNELQGAGIEKHSGTGHVELPEDSR